MAGISVGSVSVDVVPDVSNFATDVRARLVPAADQIGRDIGQRITKQISDSIGRGVSDGARAAQGNSARAGDSTGGAFADAFKARVAAALRNLPKPRVGLDATEADAELADIRARMEALRDVRVGVDLSAEEAIAELDRLKLRVDELGARSPNVDVRVDAARASAELAAVQAEVDALDGRTAHVNVDVGSGGGGVGLLAGMLGLGPALIPVGAAGIAGFAGISTAALAGAGGLGALALGVSGVSKAVNLLGQEQTAAAQDATRLAGSSTSSAAAQAAAANQVKSAQAALANARANAADAAVTAAQRVVQAEQTLTAANRQAASAQKALNDAREQAIRDLEDSANRQADAQLSAKQAALDVQQAQQNLAQLGAGGAPVTELQRQQAVLAVAEAQQRLKEAQLEATRATVDNTKAQQAGVSGDRNVVSAQQAIANALDAQQKAQQGLADAQRAQAAQARQSAYSIQQAQQQVANAMLATQRAAQGGGTAASSALAKVRAELAKVPPATLALAELWQNQLLPAFNNLRNAAAAGLLPGIEAGFKALTPTIPEFTGFIGGLATTMGDLFTQASKALTSPFWQSFFDYVSTTAGPTLDTMGKSLGNIAQGFAGLLKAFSPVTTQLGEGILGLTRKFANWASTLDTNQGFQHFLTYVHDNGPLVARTIGDIAHAVGAILAFAAPLGPPMLQLIDGFAKLVGQPVVAGIAAFTLVGVGWVSMLSKAGKALLNLNGKLDTLGGKVPGMQGKMGVLAKSFSGVAAAIGAFGIGAATQGQGAGATAIGTLGGAVTGMITGLAIGGPFGGAIGAAGGALAALAGHFLDVGGSAKTATDRMSEYQTALDKMVKDSITNEKSLATLLGTPLGMSASSILNPTPSAATTAAANKLIQQGINPVDVLLGSAPKTTTTTTKTTRTPAGHPVFMARGGIIGPGGVLPGYAPGRDSILAMLSPGEAVLRPEVARFLGADVINTLNAAGPALAYNGSDTNGTLIHAMISGASGGASAGGLHIHGDINVVSAPGEPAATSVPRGLRNLALSLGL